MSKDPFWTKKYINRAYVSKPKNFPVIPIKNDTSSKNVKKDLNTQYIIDTQEYPENFYEGFYLRGKEKNEIMKASKGKPKKFKIHDYNDKRLSEFFDIKNTPGPGAYTQRQEDSLIIKKPESLNGWKAFNVKTHGMTVRERNLTRSDG